ncbi:hypothetical protein Tsubulata_015797 [Turnera subulata]|uniref:Late embryogenesis abundant protein LEA-2 subgroup domain-containing protein n=1 Tax=Turnera subulata TaxID=218843 RepID=A0A9Q0JHF0_9ROSI|nr:hypothetical protein Tsubulata_015797 [Turnera subulata]
MISLQPPPPPPPPLPSSSLPTPEEHYIPVTPNQIVISKQNRIKQNSAAEISNLDSKTSSRPLKFQHPRPRRTNPLIWCAAILCLIFSLVLIFLGIATLIIYLVLRPKNPTFDTPNGNLNVIYFDSPEYFNGDLTFIANFSNPNQKIDVRFEYLDLELYFQDRLIGRQALQPFTERRRETRLESIHIITSLVYLPPNHATELQKQVLANKIIYNIRGTFKVRANLGPLRYSYWLHGRCEIQMTGPPTGVIVARSCKTKR